MGIVAEYFVNEGFVIAYDGTMSRWRQVAVFKEAEDETE
jgi:hypothetical protein